MLIVGLEFDTPGPATLATTGGEILAFRQSPQSRVAESRRAARLGWLRFKRRVVQNYLP